MKELYNFKISKDLTRITRLVAILSSRGITGTRLSQTQE